MISTHTLTWSVTYNPCSISISRGISTHTLTWSVTTMLPLKGNKEMNFNSHAHVERDLRWRQKAIKKAHFNSHAHVERDNEFMTMQKMLENFNSHAHVERDFW